MSQEAMRVDASTENAIEAVADEDKKKPENKAETREIYLEDLVEPYLNEEVRDLYALDYVSGSKSVWDLRRGNEEKLENKRNTEKYKKYAKKFEEEMFGERGLPDYLEKKIRSKKLDPENKKEIEKEIIGYLHTKNLKKPLRFMVYDILAKENLDEDQKKDIEEVFRDYKYSSGNASKKKLEEFLKKFLNRHERKGAEASGEDKEEAIENVSVEQTRDSKGGGESEGEGVISGASQDDEGNQTSATRSVASGQGAGNGSEKDSRMTGNGREEISPAELKKLQERFDKYEWNRVYSNPDGEEMKIVDFKPEDMKIVVVEFSDPFESLGKEENGDGESVPNWGFSGKSKNEGVEKEMDLDEFEDWFKKKGFYLESEEVVGGKESGEDKDEEEDEETENQEPIVEEEANDSLSGTQSEGNEQQGESSKMDEEKGAGEKTEKELEERMEKIKGMYVYGNGEVINIISGSEKGKVKFVEGGKEVDIDDVERVLIRKQNNGELQKIESVDNYINYLEKNILATYTDIGIDRDTFRVMKYFFDDETKRFKAKIEENGKTREKGISLNLLRNKISELEKKHIEIMKAELGAPGEKVYQKKDKGTLFTIKDYKIDRRTGNRRIVMETQQGGKRATFNYRDFWSSFAEIEDEKEDQERGAVQGQNDRGASGSQPVSGSSQAGRPEGEKGGQPEDQLEQVSVDAEEYLKNYAESDQDYINTELEKNKKDKIELEGLDLTEKEKIFVREGLIPYVKRFMDMLEEDRFDSKERGASEDEISREIEDEKKHYWEKELPGILLGYQKYLPREKWGKVIEYLKGLEY